MVPSTTKGLPVWLYQYMFLTCSYIALAFFHRFPILFVIMFYMLIAVLEHCPYILRCLSCFYISRQFFCMLTV